MTVKDIMKQWKKQLKEQGLWDKEVWVTNSHVERFETIQITLPRDPENGIDHLRWIRLGYMSNSNYGNIATVSLTDR